MIADSEGQAELDRRVETLHREIDIGQASQDSNRTILLAGLHRDSEVLQAHMGELFTTAQRERLMADDAIREVVAALALRLDQRYDDQTKALEAARESSDKAVSVALVNAEKAVQVANVANEKRLDAVNEFRGQQEDIINGFLPRVQFEVQHQALEDKVASLASRMDRTESLTQGITSVTGTGYEESKARQTDALAGEADRRARTSQLIAVVAVLVAVIAVVVSIYVHTK
jgi:cobalamin biosynthesis Mg chelatase CobN